MDTKDVKTVAMFGPSISDPSKIVNRDVPEADIGAYKAAGYQLGSIPEEKPARVPAESLVERVPGESLVEAPKKGKKK
jgi:hypothetical protein